MFPLFRFAYRQSDVMLARQRIWVGYGSSRNWLDREQGEGHEFLHKATQVKNIWVPSGE